MYSDVCPGWTLMFSHRKTVTGIPLPTLAGTDNDS
jgi:hypothetical protein